MKVLGRSWPTERFDELGFPAPGLPARRVQQVLQRLALYGLVGHAPGTKACNHRAVRAPQRRGVWVIGNIEAVAFWQLRWSVCFAHAACYVTRKLADQILIHRSAWKVNSQKFGRRAQSRSTASSHAGALSKDGSVSSPRAPPTATPSGSVSNEEGRFGNRLHPSP